MNLGVRTRTNKLGTGSLTSRVVGTVVIVELPSVEQARAWYASPAYQEILPLRTGNIRGDVIVVDGVPPDYDPTATAAALRAQTASRPG